MNIDDCNQQIYLKSKYLHLFHWGKKKRKMKQHTKVQLLVKICPVISEVEALLSIYIVFL